MQKNRVVNNIGRRRISYLLEGAILCCAVSLMLWIPSAAMAQSPEKGSETLIQTFDFVPPAMQTLDMDGAAYATLAMPGALNLARNPGDPALPVYFVRILVPHGKAVKDVTVKGELEEIEGASGLVVFPYQEPLPFGQPRPDTLTVNEATYSSDALFPAANYGDYKVGWCRGYAILSLSLMPVKYLPATGQLFAFKEMTVTLDLEDSNGWNPRLRPDVQDDVDWVERLVCNPAATHSYLTSGGGRAEYPGGLCDPADDYDYVIITTTQGGLDYWAPGGSTPYNWESLMNKHAAVSGLKCTLVLVEDIDRHPDYTQPAPYNDGPAFIREFCKDAYQDWGTQYILIGGDDEWIPAREMDSTAEGNVDADIYWNHLDLTFNDDKDGSWGEENDTGFDLYAELFIGRVTCDVPQDVSNWLTKVFYYMDSQERDYLDNAAFYGGDTGWNCQGDDFEDYSAIQGVDHWLGPNPYNGDPSYPSWVGFQYGFETWNQENPSQQYNMDVKWTAEPPNPTGWKGGSDSAAINGLRTDISNDEVSLLFGIAHANSSMSLDVGSSSWESSYHNTKPFFIHDYGCHCGDPDTSDGVLHSMLFHSDTELAFACVYNTGYGWGNFDNTGSSSALQQKSFVDYLFDVQSNSGHTDNWQMGKAQAFSKDLMAGTIDWGGSWRSIIQCCLLFGDPAQRIKPPEEPAIFLSFPDGLPSGHYPPGPCTTITVKIENGLENLVPGSETLYYCFDPADPYTPVTLTSLGGNLYEGTLPNTAPLDEPQFYFSAQGDGGTTVYAPWNAPTQVYGFDVYLVEELFMEDFETHPGWSIENQNVSTGEWEWADPIGTGAQPEDDHTVNGTHCYVTGRLGGGIGDDDVDGGPTILTSNTFDLSSGDADLNFYLWFYHSDNGAMEPLRIDISNDNGTSWTRLADIGNSPGWILRTYRVSDFVTPTSQMQVSFAAEDNPNDSVVEAALDDFQVARLNYNPGLYADGYTIPVAAGKVIDFKLNAGAVNANRPYGLLGSATGTSPGLPLPGGATLPIKWDMFTRIIIGNLGSPLFQNFSGMLDGLGNGTATLDTGGAVDPALAGLTLYFAYFLKPVPFFASNYIEVVLEP